MRRFKAMLTLTEEGQEATAETFDLDVSITTSESEEIEECSECGAEENRKIYNAYFNRETHGKIPGKYFCTSWVSTDQAIRKVIFTLLGEMAGNSGFPNRSEVER